MVRLPSSFISAGHLSAYQLFKEEKLMNGKLHYKSAHKIFQKTVDPKTVERVTGNTQLSEKESARNPKCKLSEQGLFTLYIKNRTLSISNGHRVKWPKKIKTGVFIKGFVIKIQKIWFS